MKANDLGMTATLHQQFKNADPVVSDLPSAPIIRRDRPPCPFVPTNCLKGGLISSLSEDDVLVLGGVHAAP